MSVLIEAFLFFIKTGFFSIGGGYAAITMIQAQMVDVWHLMTLSEFSDLVAIAEMTPGPLTLNAATFVGNKLAGIPGGIICTVGYVLPALLMCTVISYIYYKYRGLGGIQQILAALRPAVIALIAFTCLSMISLALFQSNIGNIKLSNFHPVECILFLLSLLILRKYKPGPVVIILGTGIIGTIIYLLFGSAL